LAVLYRGSREPEAHQAPNSVAPSKRRMLLKGRQAQKGGLTEPPQLPFVIPARATRRFVNRTNELAALDGLLASARSGSSAVLILRGGPGVGKTMLLERAIEQASGFRVGRVGGVDSELDLPYAGLHQLLVPFLQEIEDLPGPQRDALASTLGLIEAKRSDRFLTALGVLTLLSNAAKETGLLCAVDDAEWLDEASAQVLSFVARRLFCEGIAMLFTFGAPYATPTGLAPFRELSFDGLSQASSRKLLDQEVEGPLDSDVRDRLIVEVEGNPLALIELAHLLTPEQLGGLAPLPEALPLGDRLEKSLMRNVRGLSSDARSVLVLVATERSGDPALLRRAADGLGLSETAIGDAESVLRLGSQITFRHGFVRSAVYALASETSRRDAHLALAAAMDPVADEDRIAWHRAAASADADEAVAGDLETSARKARDRGGHAAAAAVLELAARLTPDPTRRATRLLVAVEAELDAGALDKAAGLLSQVSLQRLNDGQRAEAQRLRAMSALAGGGDGATSSLLLEAAQVLAPFDPRKARDTCLDALATTMFAGRLATEGTVSEAVRVARSIAKPTKAQTTAADLLLDGFATRFTEGSAAAAPALRRGIKLARKNGGVRAIGPAYQAAFELWDDAALHDLAQRRVDLARRSGALIALPNALSQLGAYEVIVGRFAAAEACFEEADEISEATGSPGLLGRSGIGALVVSAWRGQEGRARALAEACARDGAARGFGTFIGIAQYALSVLELALGRYREAMIAAQDASLDPVLVTRILPDLVEAAARCGEEQFAAKAAGELRESTTASGTDWALGTLARSQALLAGGKEAEALYREAIDRLQRCRATTQLARARLVYGEWLRRERRRIDAREELRAASQLFEGMGALAFADRAQNELAATGERVHRRTPEALELLTPQERRIATLVAEGSSNSDAAAQLFISSRTVEYHLAKVFRKLRISSRSELARSLLEAREENLR
jgi:DNA-binding CsgD family transcriptional regulator